MIVILCDGSSKGNPGQPRQELSPGIKQATQN